MILIVLAVVAYLLFAGKSAPTVSGDGVSGAGITPLPPTVNPSGLVIPAPQTEVIKNATGGSLSAALGSNGAPPSYYVSGNPGYTTQVRPNTGLQNTGSNVVRSGAPFKTFNDILPSRQTIPQPSRGTVATPVKSPTNPLGTFKPVIAARPVVVARVGPEVAAAPWTKLPLRSFKAS